MGLLSPAEDGGHSEGGLRSPPATPLLEQRRAAGGAGGAPGKRRAPTVPCCWPRRLDVSDKRRGVAAEEAVVPEEPGAGPCSAEADGADRALPGVLGVLERLPGPRTAASRRGDANRSLPMAQADGVAAGDRQPFIGTELSRKQRPGHSGPGSGKQAITQSFSPKV